ncbi:MAG: hypothetical protein ABL995_18155 [Bryobacteraceae bacterium]
MTRKLPPLILHPFADRSAPNRLLESSRANLMLQGLLPQGERSQQDLEMTLLDGRFSEIRMLFYVGKDLLRWIEQCLEHVERDPVLRGSGIRYQSFASYLIGHTPLDVQAKLKKWGVNDYKAIFARALGLSVLLADAPTPGVLSDEFIRNYYRYADQFFKLRQEDSPFADIGDMGFEFDIYASGEYSRKLEREWAEQ